MNNKVGVSLVFATMLASPAAFATNGYFAHGYSTKEKGLVGAGVALPQDALAAATNPAGMVMVGSRIDVGVSLFSPIREYSAEGGPSNGCAPTGCTFSVGPQTIESENELFIIPHFGWNRMLDADSSLGLSVYGNGGMNTEYKGGTATLCTDPAGCAPTGFTTLPGTFGDGTAGVDLAQLFFNVTYARKITPTSAWGASAVVAYQRFEATGLSNFGAFSSSPANLSDNSHDTSIGLGAKIGIQGEVMPGLSLGGSYQTEIKMSEFDDYKGLFAENGDFDIPATATVGLAFRPSSASVIVFDVQKIWYSKVNAVGNRFANINTCAPGPTGGTGSGCLGASNGAGFGWDDMTIYKLGYEWQSSPAWTWRVGYSKGDQPIPSSEVLFNILAPAVIEQHFTFGFTTQLSKASEFSLALMYAPEETVRGRSPFDPGQTIELTMKQYELAANWGWKF